jgi:hypothetical protein
MLVLFFAILPAADLTALLLKCTDDASKRRQKHAQQRSCD